MYNYLKFVLQRCRPALPRWMHLTAYCRPFIAGLDFRRLTEQALTSVRTAPWQPILPILTSHEAHEVKASAACLLCTPLCSVRASQSEVPNTTLGQMPAIAVASQRCPRWLRSPDGCGLPSYRHFVDEMKEEGRGGPSGSPPPPFRRSITTLMCLSALPFCIRFQSYLSPSCLSLPSSSCHRFSSN